MVPRYAKYSKPVEEPRGREGKERNKPRFQATPSKIIAASSSWYSRTHLKSVQSLISLGQGFILILIFLCSLKSKTARCRAVGMAMLSSYERWNLPFVHTML
jgi:hypothetical protein